MHKARRLLLWLIVAFVIYAIFNSPGRAGDIVHSAWDIIAQAGKSLGAFFDSILGKK